MSEHDAPPAIPAEAVDSKAPLTNLKSWEQIVEEHKAVASKAVEPLRKTCQEVVEKIDVLTSDPNMTAADRESGLAAIRIIKSVADQVEAHIAEKPHRILNLLSDVLGEIELAPEAQEIAEARSSIAAMSPADQREIEHLGRVLRSDDPISVIVGGHVFIDIALEDCFKAYLPHDIDLHNDLQIFSSAKIKLARALGMITQAETELFLLFNSIRNKVAHRTERRGKPRYIFDVQNEAALWAEFVDNAAFAGLWPKYNAAKFLDYTKTVAFALHFRLLARVAELKRKPLVDIVEPPSVVMRTLLPGMTALYMKGIVSITNVDTAE